MNYIYVQGKLANSGLNITDRSFKYGDGVFERLRVENGKIFNLPFHIKRMQMGLDDLKIKYDITPIFAQVLQEIKPQNGFVRIQISRGSGGGYLPKNAVPFASLEVTQDLPQATNCSVFVSSRQAHIISQAKTANALNYVLAAIEANENNADNALLLDAHGNICECENANIFWVKNNKLYTPALDLPLITGSVQNLILQKFEVQQGHFKLSELVNIDEIFMTNVTVIAQSIIEIKGIGNYQNNSWAGRIKEMVLNAGNFV